MIFLEGYVMRNAVAAVAALFIAGQAQAAEFVTNGDFEAGNNDFVSAYTYTPPGTDNNTAAGQYTVSNDAFDWNSRFTSYGDNTSGSGLFMVVNGDDQPTAFWLQDLTGLQVGATYSFSAFASNACCNQPIENSSPALSARIDGVEFASFVVPIGQSGVWLGFTGSFVATAETMTLTLVNMNTAPSGNDFGIDDISVVSAVPEPASWAMMIGGFGLVGGAMRVRRRAVVTA